MSKPSLPLDRYPLVETTSVEEAREVYSATTTPVRVELTDRTTPFHWQCNHAAVGPLDISVHQFGAGIRGISAGSIDCFALTLSNLGYAEYETGTHTCASVANRTAVICSPRMAPSVRLHEGHQGIQVTIERSAMDAAFTALTGAKPREQLRFKMELDLATGVGASAERFIRFLVNELDHGGAALRSAIVANRLVEGFLCGLLLEQPHSCSEQLQPAPADIGPDYVRRVEAYLEANADSPITLADLAALTGVSVRSIQAAFRASRGYTPMEFLRTRRFELARQRLLTSQDATGKTVTQVALACGFEHLGRFSIEYRARFGESPRDTLRRALAK